MISAVINAVLSWVVGSVLNKIFPPKTAESVELKQVKETLDAKEKMDSVDDVPASKRLRDRDF